MSVYLLLPDADQWLTLDRWADDEGEGQARERLSQLLHSSKNPVTSNFRKHRWNNDVHCTTADHKSNSSFTFVNLTDISRTNDKRGGLAVVLFDRSLFKLFHAEIFKQIGAGYSANPVSVVLNQLLFPNKA